MAAMLMMAVCLLALVTAFFWFIVGPNLDATIYRLAEEYSRAFAASSPDLETARPLAARVGVRVRYEGPDSGWTTSADLPLINDLRNGRARDSHLLLSPKYFMVSAPGGGTYLFAWSFSRGLQAAHVRMLFLLLFVIVAVVFTTHAVLKRLLRPLRILSDGVARLSEGQLGVTLAGGSRDEFGRLIDAFNDMAARVRAMIGARDQLLSDVSHELRSPLTRMKVVLELPAGDKQRARLAADVDEMERMVSELLELERLRSGRGLEIAREDLMAILRHVAEEFREGSPGVRVVGPSREVWVDVEGGKIRTVLRNLLENATKYSPPGSRDVELCTEADGDAVVVRVTDDGPCIPDGDSERVFEPFFRLDASRSKRTGGYGLGLSICRRVMQAHGGSIAVERGAGRGASFVLTFPKPDPASSTKR